MPPSAQPGDLHRGAKHWLLAIVTALFVAEPLFPNDSPPMLGLGLPMVMLWLLPAGLWACREIVAGRFRIRFGWIDAAVLLLAAMHTSAAIWATVDGSPRPAVNALWNWIALTIGFFLARQLITTTREARAVMGAMIALAAALSVYGLFQQFYELPMTRQEYLENPDAMLRSSDMWYEPGSPERELFERRLETAGPLGTFVLSNSLAAFLAPWFVVLCGLAFGAAGNRKRLIITAATIAACLLLTKSRSGCLAAAMGLAVVAVAHYATKYRASRKTYLIAAVCAIILISAALTVGLLVPQAYSKAAASLGYRLQYWQSTALMIEDHPWLGCGPGNFQNAYTKYKLPEASEEITDPHNFLLEIWATSGTPAMAALLAALGCFGFSVCRVRACTHQINDSQTSRVRACTHQVNDSQLGAKLASSYSTIFILAGAACGFPVAWVLGIIAGNSPGAAAILLIVPAAACGIALLYDWIEHGRLPAALPALGVAVMLVDLLTTGGFTSQGVSGSFWLLLAIGLGAIRDENGSEAEKNHKGQAGKPFQKSTGIDEAGCKQPSPLPSPGGRGDASKQLPSPLPSPSGRGEETAIQPSPLPSPKGRGDIMTLPRGAAIAAFILIIAAAVACFFSAYSPVLRCQGDLQSAQHELEEGRPDRAIEKLKAAAAADPLSSEPWRQLAELTLQSWLRLPTASSFDDFEHYNRMMLQLSENSAPAFLASGDWHLAAFSKGTWTDERQRSAALTSAIQAYEKAVQLYPNKALNHAKLALAFKAAGDQSRYREEADLALRLDDLSPHLESKLGVLRQQLQ
jgi:O-antigen ligase